MGRILRVLATALVISTGIYVLIGLLAGDGLGFLSVISQQGGVVANTNALLQLISITIAVTVFIGILNLLWVHLARVRRRGRGWGYSLLLVLTTSAVLLLTALERNNILTGDPPITRILLEQIQVSIESALSGLLLFALVYGAYRVLHNRVSLWGLLFVASMLIVLVGALPLGIAAITDLRDLWLSVPVSAGARGILLGIALATIVTGVRVLVGQDRSYRE